MGEFQVNTDPAAGKREPAVAGLKNGGFVSVWSSANQDSSGLGVYGQRFDNNGTPVGEEFPINTTTAQNQFEPSIAALNDGGFVVTWTSYGQDSGDFKTFRDSVEFVRDDSGKFMGMETVRVESELEDSAGVFAQRYDADGTPVGTEFQVNTKTVCHQHHSQVASLINGDFVVIWVQYAPMVRSAVGSAGYISEGGSYGGNGVFGQRYNADGTPTGGEFRVNPRSASSALDSRVSVAGLNNGGFVVTWWVQACYGRLYNADGTPASGEFKVDDTIGFAKVKGLSQGGFVVAWGYRGIVQAKIYNAEGSLKDTIQVSTTAVQGQDVANVTALNDGGFVVGWNFRNADENITHLCAQRYNADGSPVGSEFRLNKKKAGAFALTTLNDDKIVACWLGQGAKEEVVLVATVEWLSSSQYDTGTFSGFELDESGNCLETHVGGGRLYYRVGSINKDDKTISFGTSTRFANGTSTSVSLAEDGNFVEVHTSGGKLYSRVAKANFSSKTIAWKTDGTPYQQYDTGNYCSVVADKESNCLEIHTGSSGLYYRIGKVNYTSKTVDWGTGSSLISQGNYSQCSLTMDAEGNCVATAAGGGLVYAHVGKFTGNSVEWGESHQFEQGSLTSVALDGEGNCLETHTKDNRLYYCIGKLDSSSKSITWSEATQYSENDSKQYSFTHIACDSQGNYFEIHVIAGSPNRLYYRPATFIPAPQTQGQSSDQVQIEEQSSEQVPDQIWAVIA